MGYSIFQRSDGKLESVSIGREKVGNSLIYTFRLTTFNDDGTTDGYGLLSNNPYSDAGFVSEFPAGSGKTITPTKFGYIKHIPGSYTKLNDPASNDTGITVLPQKSNKFLIVGSQSIKRYFSTADTTASTGYTDLDETFSWDGGIN